MAALELHIYYLILSSNRAKLCTVVALLDIISCCCELSMFRQHKLTLTLYHGVLTRTHSDPNISFPTGLSHQHGLL